MHITCAKIRATKDEQVVNEDQSLTPGLPGPVLRFVAPLLLIHLGAVWNPTHNRLPVGLQVVAPQGRDVDVLAAAEILEEALT